LPTLPPIQDGIPDVFIEGQELDFGHVARAGGGDDLVDDDVSSNDDENTNNNDPFDDDDDDDDEDSNGLDYSSDDDDNNLRFDADLEEFKLVDFADPNPGKKMPVDRRRYKDGPSPPDYSVMSSVEKSIAKEAYNRDRRKWVDQRRKKRVNSLAEIELNWTGVCTATLHTINEVENGTRLAVGQTFLNRDLIKIRTAEEANLHGIYVTILKSSKFTFCSSGIGFGVSATNSESSGWKITKCIIREGDTGGDVLANAASTGRSPFHAEWLIPIIMPTIAETPMASNMMLRAILKPYVKEAFLTDGIVQVAWTTARKLLFGIPSENVIYTHHVANRLREQGHHVSIKYTTRKEALKNIDRLVVSEELLRLKAKNETLSMEERHSFVVNWKKANKSLLVSPLGSTKHHLRFVHGVFFALSFSTRTVPELQ